MKICLISNLYEPLARGGAENVVKQTAEGLLKAGHEIFIITTSPDNTSTKQTKQNNFAIYRFKPMNLFYYLKLDEKNILLKILWHFINIFNFSASSFVEKILKNEKPDIVMTHNLMGIGFTIPKLINKLNIRHFHILHDVQLAVPSGLIFKNKEKSFLVNGFLTKIYAKICAKQFGSPDVIISPSKWLLNFYKEKGFFKKSHQVILPNPIEIDLDNKIKTKKQNKFLFIGQLEKHKGLEWLINFWQEKKLKQELHIVGSGSMQITNNKFIKYLGKKTGEELKNIFSEIDFLIVPSLCYENSPTVIPLSYNYGTSVVASSIGGIPELVEDQKTGYLFEAENDKNFEQIIKKCIKMTDDEYSKLSKNCQIKLNTFDIDEYIKKLENL